MFKLRKDCFWKGGLLCIASVGAYLVSFHGFHRLQHNAPQTHQFLSAKNDKVIPITAEQQSVKSIYSSNLTKSETASTDWFKVLTNKATIWYHQVFLGESLGDFRKWAIRNQRLAIRQELSSFKLLPPGVSDWKEIIPENGGRPIRNVIFTTWRSGSTFLGQILNSHPGTFYHYEPLQSFEIVQVRGGELAEKALKMLRNALNCDFKREQIKYGDDHFWFYTQNTRVAQYCQHNHEVCFDPEFQSAMCLLFPFQALKTVRMRLSLGRHLLEDPAMNIRLLYLVRDPRGTLQSRRYRDWCPGVPDCDSPKVLCRDLVEDFYAAAALRREFPSGVMILRYEDFALNIYDAVKRIFQFFRLQYRPEVEQFLRSHTTVDVGGLYSTQRNSKATPFHWRQDFANNFREVHEIQFECKTAMTLWGYEMAKDPAHMLTFNPIGKPPWADMEFPQCIQLRAPDLVIN